MAHALGVDVGSTNVKVTLVEPEGRVVAAGSAALHTTRKGERAEQDASELWHQVGATIASVCDAAGSAATDVAAIGVCSQYSSIVPVDRSANPVGPLVMWTDKRGTDHSHAILTRHDEAFTAWIERHGIPPVGNGLALAHILHFEIDRPEIAAATAAYLEPMDYLTARLTGRIVATQHTMFMSQLCDNRNLGVTDYEPDLVRMSGVDPSRLPPLIAPSEPVGTVAPEVAARLGLPPSAVVFAGTNDTSTDAVATGAYERGRGGLAIGTTSVLVDTVDHQGADYDHEILAMPGPLGEEYLVWAENGVGGRALEHVLEHVVHAEDELGDHGTDDRFARLDAALESVPIGSEGVVFVPFLEGSLSPEVDPALRAAFVNLSFATRRTHMVRAVTEGVACNLGRLLPHVEAFTGRSMEEIVFVGGAARSHAWCQILADVLERPVLPARSPESAVARAAALLALFRRGALTRHDLAARVETERAYEPVAGSVDAYREVSARFVAAVEAVKTFHGAPIVTEGP